MSEFAEWAYAFDAVRFARERLGWGPDEKQASILRDFRTRVILNWGRQSGKSTLAAAKMAHMAVTIPGTVFPRSRKSPASIPTFPR